MAGIGITHHLDFGQKILDIVSSDFFPPRDFYWCSTMEGG